MLTLAVLVALVMPASVPADADPASDVLIGERRVLPQQPTSLNQPSEDPER